VTLSCKGGVASVSPGNCSEGWNGHNRTASQRVEYAVVKEPKPKRRASHERKARASPARRKLGRSASGFHTAPYGSRTHYGKGRASHTASKPHASLHPDG